ncbi:MAG: ABC transporter permease [Alphaproteobacteria bacterium]|nr:ABC transporter permease [Alphaproteobacteria bacterium]
MTADPAAEATAEAGGGTARIAPLALVVGLARRSPTTLVGAAIIAAFAVMAIFAPWIMPYAPDFGFADRILQPPGAQHWFGTDGNGMDVFSRTVFGATYGFGIALPVVVVALSVGVPVGLYAGYRGGLLDEALMRLIDALRVFPSIIVALAVVAATSPSLLNIVLVVGVLDAPAFARLVRSEVLGLRASNFVESAIAAGNPTRRILFVHILPNAIQGAMAQTAVRAAWAVRISATLAFLGIGIQPPAAEWGAMIRQGAEFFVTGEWWVGVFPGIALVFMVLGLNMLGDGLQELLDPRRKADAR